MKIRLVSFKISGPALILFGLFFSISCFSETASKNDLTCQLDEAQKLFDNIPRPVARIEALLAQCSSVAATDFRVNFLWGVLKRSAGQLTEATDNLEKARRIAPEEPMILLELAVTYEWHHELNKAKALYQSVLASNPASRPALLGIARVARAQYQLRQATDTYVDLLTRDTNDIEALNGQGQLALIDKKFELARTNFKRVLSMQADNGEAQQGLQQLDQAWRYQLDLQGGIVHLQQGQAYTGSSKLLMALDAKNTIEFGIGKNSRELPGYNPTDQTPLPKTFFRTGYQYFIPGQHGWGISYDYRLRQNLGAENRIEINGNQYFTERIRGFTGIRYSFPSQWQSHLIYGGMAFPIIPSRFWNITISGYYGHQNQINTRTLIIDVNREGPGRFFYNFGTGYSIDPHDFMVHGRFIIPLSQKLALTFSIERRTFNKAIELNAGVRMFFK